MKHVQCKQKVCGMCESPRAHYRAHCMYSFLCKHVHAHICTCHQVSIRSPLCIGIDLCNWLEAARVTGSTPGSSTDHHLVIVNFVEMHSLMSTCRCCATVCAMASSNTIFTFLSVLAERMLAHIR